MVDARDEKERTRLFCDDVYAELTGMGLKLRTMIDELSMAYGEESEPFHAFKRHLVELADQIAWRLEILSHVCPYEWKGSREQVESRVSVPPPDAAAAEFAGGYLGG